MLLAAKRNILRTVFCAAGLSVILIKRHSFSTGSFRVSIRVDLLQTTSEAGHSKTASCPLYVEPFHGNARPIGSVLCNEDNKESGGNLDSVIDWALAKRRFQDASRDSMTGGFASHDAHESGFFRRSTSGRPSAPHPVSVRGRDTTR